MEAGNREPYFVTYEKRLRLSLLLLVLLTVTANLATVSLLARTRQTLCDVSLASIEAAMNHVLDDAGTDPSGLDWSKAFGRLAGQYQLKSILVLHPLSRQPIYTYPAGTSNRTIDLPELQQALRHGEDASFIGKVPTGESVQMAIRFLPRALVVLTAALPPNEPSPTAYRVELAIRILGLSASIVLAMALLREILRPYRELRKVATSAGTPGKAEESDVAFVVQSYKQMVAELREKEKTLRELYEKASEQADTLSRYSQSVLESMTSGVVNFDQQGRVTYLNRSAQEILGVTPVEGRQRLAEELFGSGTSVQTILDDALKAGRVHNRAEVMITRRDGREIWIGLSSSILRDPQGALRGAVVLLTDLTEVKRLQEQVSLSERLATLGEISAGIAHEFRNSLGTILGFAKLLERKAEPAPPNDIIRAIVRESLNLEATLEEFLIFSRPERINLEEVNLIDSIQETLASIDNELNDRGIRHIVEGESTLPSIRADQLLLQRAFLNLFHNALDAIEGQGEIRVSIRNHPTGQLVEIRVSDSGPGIPEENLKSIFMPFFTTKAKGFGLGLGIVQKVVIAHQGHIEVKNRPPHGAEFVILLPVMGPGTVGVPTPSMAPGERASWTET